jgi:hypothetical protein
LEQRKLLNERKKSKQKPTSCKGKATKYKKGNKQGSAGWRKNSVRLSLYIQKSKN